MNWRLKIIIKIIVSRLPIPYKFWKGMGLFQHGQMNTSIYSEKVFNMHFKHFSDQEFRNGFNMLELGPGDSALSALYGYLNGANNIYLLDVGNFASTNMDLYKTSFEKWCEQNELTRLRPDFSCFEQFLSSINASYFVDGLVGFKKIKSGSIDFIFSHSVLEHVLKAEFDSLFAELYRVSKSKVVSSHNIDYMDHLGGGQNNLRFSHSLWESDLFAKSGFYTNRIPAPVVHQKVRNAGFKVVQEQFGLWKDKAVSCDTIHPDLRGEYIQESSAPTSSMLLTK